MAGGVARFKREYDSICCSLTCPNCQVNVSKTPGNLTAQFQQRSLKRHWMSSVSSLRAQGPRKHAAKCHPDRSRSSSYTPDKVLMTLYEWYRAQWLIRCFMAWRYYTRSEELKLNVHRPV
eukprot:scpid63018/ scgid13532/ 